MRTITVFALGVLVLAAQAARAQIPDEFSNLQVLPEATAKGELVGIMRGFATALGVRCLHCHVGSDPDSLEGYDFASDDKEPKRVARAMMRMVDTINAELLPKTGRAELIAVECVTCHGGLARPERIVDVLSATIEEQGVDAALTRYRELREEHYGTAAYDFSPSPLNEIAETLARSDKLPEAIALMRLNRELNPDVSYVHFLLGRLLMMGGEREAGLASMSRAVELEPDNPWFKQMIERARQQGGGDD